MHLSEKIGQYFWKQTSDEKFYPAVASINYLNERKLKIFVNFIYQWPIDIKRSCQTNTTNEYFYN